MNNSCKETPSIGKKLELVSPLHGTSTIVVGHPVLSTTSIGHPKGCTLSKNKSSWMQRNCCTSLAMIELWDRLFDEAYRADVKIHTDNGTIIYAHASILGFASPVFRSMFKKSRSRGIISIPIRGVPAEAVRIFIRFLYTSCYEQAQVEEHVLSLLVLSHAFAVPKLKRECEYQLEHLLLNVDNVVDVFQLALLCDAPRLSIICHRFMLRSFNAVSSSAGWKAMRESHPALEKELLESVREEDRRQKEKMRKREERKIYAELYEAMEALVEICRDKVQKEDQKACKYEGCRGLESLVRHFYGCKLRVSGGCPHCKRMWQLLELHARLCANSNACRVPLCRRFKQKIAKANKKKRKKKDETKWNILARKVLRSKSITGAPYFRLALS
ncbi:BTB/POZ and TAZ domain-containing protein 4-like [Cynara cardunculus var. scolymus]|uniref:BTB/POZ-like protein n=1 Tax=Cynara cardunculus var. scolymus TaxID=59895 RepID=A0A118K5D2_CYNCS|nr:BTB/POZ and TAZ domain-containing protein 4-like [Cynara cardunculus var. scolymus]KVI08913.1 BTB/POZ-like protein [Cynara cardunculus var. scolymus]